MKLVTTKCGEVLNREWLSRNASPDYLKAGNKFITKGVYRWTTSGQAYGPRSSDPSFFWGIEPSMGSTEKVQQTVGRYSSGVCWKVEWVEHRPSE